MRLQDLVFGKSVPYESTFPDPANHTNRIQINSTSEWKDYLSKVGNSVPIVLKAVRQTREPHGGLFSFVPVCDFDFCSDSRQWYSVQDNLPPLSGDCGYGVEESEVVLVALKSGRMFTARLRDGYDDDEPARWVLCGRDGYIADDVTHWQPLPEAPTASAIPLAPDANSED